MHLFLFVRRVAEGQHSPAAQLKMRFHRLASFVLLLVGSGCVPRAELVTLREGMDRGTATIRTQHLEWAQLLASGRRADLPDLDSIDLRAVERAHAEYRLLVEASRSQDWESQ